MSMFVVIVKLHCVFAKVGEYTCVADDDSAWWRWVWIFLVKINVADGCWRNDTWIWVGELIDIFHGVKFGHSSPSRDYWTLHVEHCKKWLTLQRLHNHCYDALIFASLKVIKTDECISTLSHITLVLKQYNRERNHSNHNYQKYQKSRQYNYNDGRSRMNIIFCVCINGR